MLLIMLCFTLAACTKEPEAPPDDGGDEQHTHSYEASTLIPATFSYCGTTKYTCSCGDTYEAPTPAGNIALRDYKDEEHNSLYGLTVNTEDVQTGPSAVWTPSAGAFYIDEPAVNDLTGYLELNVWIKNNSSSPINLVFYAFSDFIGTPAADCYYGTFTVESGWYKYSIPISNLVASGSPVGFDKIDYFSIEVLRTKVDPSTTLYIDTLYAATEKSGGYVADKLAPTKNAVVFYEGSDACLFNQMRGKRNFKVVSDSNTTFIPAAILAEHRGATNIVSSANALSFSYNGTEYSYSLGQSFDYTAVENGNNAGKALSSKAISSGDYLMLPMEVCAEIFGYKLFFDRMGLVLFSDNKIAYSLSSDESITVNGGNITSLFTVIEQVAYEHYTGSEIIALMNSKYPDDKHGRLMIDQAKFDELKELLKTDETLKAWVAGIEKGYGKSSSKFSAAPNVYHLSDGYRLLNASRDVMNKVMSWSLLYKLTDDTAYAERVWKELESVCKFTDPVTGAKSWHPEHFLDTAEIMYPFAIAYDWLYYYWTPERREILEDAALELGFGAALGFGGVADWWKDGKNSANAIANGYNGYKYKAPYPYNALNSDPSIFYTGAPWTNNWNGVCNGGMTALCLAFANVNDEFREYSEYLLSCIFYSVQPGLIEGYAPDGGYPESPGYWAYGTTYLAILFSCLQSACGTDFGFTNSPGFSESFYFVSYLAS
ncbi:MAG: hypothetical protein IJY04_04670, partial [Clostridia bacterium]|nr:hypothetical protein [Clostridia bacterium]